MRVVIKGWPATAERVFLSLRICSICFNRITTEGELGRLHRYSWLHVIMWVTKGELLTVDLAKYLERKHLTLTLRGLPPKSC